MITTNDRMRDFIEDFVCSMRPGQVINPFLARRLVMRKMSLEPRMCLVRNKLNEMCSGSAPELESLPYGWYRKLEIKSNDALTDESRSFILKTQE